MRRTVREPVVAVVLCLAVAFIPASATAASPAAELVAAGSNVENPQITPDGRYVVFDAYGPGYVSQATQGWQVYLFDRSTRKTELVSVSPTGAPANNRSVDPSISDDGCRIAFASDATNLVSGDTNGATDVFVRDRCGTPKTVLASVDASGKQLQAGGAAPDISGSGNAVAFESATASATGIQLYDTAKATSAQITPDGRVPSISADGTRVAFWSYASNLVPNDKNAAWDIFLWAGGTIHLVTADANGVQQSIPGALSSIVMPGISADGSHVAFPSNAPNLVPGDTNGADDVFVKDVSNAAALPAGPIVRASVSSAGAQGDRDSSDDDRPSLSRDGRYVLFVTDAKTLAPETKGLPSSLVLRDDVGDKTYGLYAGGIGPHPALSPDAAGRYLAFVSSAALDPASHSGGVFVLDRQAASTGGGGAAAGSGGAPPPPVRGVSVDGAPVKGTVLVNGKPLTGAERIPVGALIDATRGTVRITSANGTMDFYSGAFVVRETKAPGPTELDLRGGSFASCPKPGKRVIHAVPPPVRSLWGNGHGNFRTRGRYVAATVRGTIWLTQDRCNGSYVSVRRGVVDVLDLVRHTTTTVRAGHSILVKPR